MARAAAEAGLVRIIYLGGLGGAGDPHLSEHLRSRYEVAQILRSGPVPVTFLRAAMILGSGSASFEILRYLVERLPVMLTPRWVRNPVQRIAITNVLNYLEGCLAKDEVRGQTFDIGGPEVVSYRQLFDIYAEEAGLRRRLIISVPVLTPKLSSYWIHLVTPVPAAIARPLAEGLRRCLLTKRAHSNTAFHDDLAMIQPLDMRIGSPWITATAQTPWFACPALDRIRESHPSAAQTIQPSHQPDHENAPVRMERTD